MSNGLRNWTFQDITDFLKQHHFAHRHTRGSHYYYVGFVDGKDKVVEVQFHAGKTIKASTLEWSIIPKSGIPKSLWLKWSAAGNNRLRKKIFYSGATEKPTTL